MIDVSSPREFSLSAGVEVEFDARQEKAAEWAETRQRGRKATAAADKAVARGRRARAEDRAAAAAARPPPLPMAEGVARTARSSTACAPLQTVI